MRTQLIRVGVTLAAMVLSGTPLYAHPSTTFHVHAEEIGGLVLASLVLLGALALRRTRSR